MKSRVGYGYDVHRLASGRRMILGGVDIPFEKGVVGHSDADVLLHAICDAILGALALGDIGRHFPDSDPKYKDISSIILLKECWKLIYSRGWVVTNIDSTVVLEKPKIAGHVDEMRRNIADALEMDIAMVSVKATTSEGLGFVGSGEGVVAHATVLLQST